MTMYEALTTSGIDSAEAKVLLCFLTGQSRAWLFTHHDQTLDYESERQWTAATERRRGGEPLAHILGQKEFYGRIFRSDARALIPRSCTESLVDDVKKFFENPQDRIQEIDPGIVSWTHVLKKETPTVILDIGTGTGCIAITLAFELPRIRMIATDVSKEALNLAKENAELLGATDRITFLESDLLQNVIVDERFLIVSNPPYLAKDSAELQDGVKEFEPSLALFAEEEGKEIVSRLIVEAKNHPSCVGWVMECPANFAKP